MFIALIRSNRLKGLSGAGALSYKSPDKKSISFLNNFIVKIILSEND